MQNKVFLQLGLLILVLMIVLVTFNKYFKKSEKYLTSDIQKKSIKELNDKSKNNIIKDIRIVLGGVSCIPMRLTACEDIARESAADEETANLSGSLAARGATPLNYNHFKVPLMENLVKRAIRNKA